MRSSELLVLASWYYDDQIKVDVMGGACGMHEGKI